MAPRIFWLAALFVPLCSLLGSHSAFPQETFPSRPIRLIAPVPPGSPPDVVARIVAQPLGRVFNQPVVVENRPGANQTIGLAAVASATADGQTLGMVSLPTAVVPSLMARMPYDTLRDLAGVREVAWTSNVLVVPADADIKSVSELIRRAKARSAKMSFASGGNGTPAHVMGELFRAQTGFDAIHVPFKGAAEGVAAVIAGHVDFMLASAGAVLPHVRAGKIRALAQTTETRLALLPTVDTFAELGFKGVTVRDWQGIVAPAGTAPATLKRLSDALHDALARPDTRERLQALAMEPVDRSDPEQFRAFLASEVRRWATVANAAGLQAQ